jgi:hypothetical protein
VVPLLKSDFVCLNCLIDILGAFEMWCYVGQMKFGFVPYADDILLLAQRTKVLKKMIKQSEDYMHQHRISISTTKTKCFFCRPNKGSLHEKKIK